MLVIFSGIAVAATDEEPGKIDLSPMSVVSSRIDENIKLMPAHITVITAQQIQQSPAKTLPDLLSLEAGVLSRSLYGNTAARATIDIRGFGASATQNTLILLDGRRLNDIDLSNVNYAAIPLHNIERIEIIRGASGVLYGDGAVGGAINIITRRPRTDSMTGTLSGGYGSYGTWQGSGVANWGGRDVAFNIAGNILESDGYRDNNELRQKNLQIDVSRYFGTTELYFKGGVSDQRLRLAGVRTVDPSMGLDELRDDRRGTGTPNDYAEEDNQFATAGLRTAILGGAGEAVFDFGYRRKNQQAFFDFGGGFTNYLDTDLQTWSVTPRIQARTGLHDWIAGFDFYLYQYDSDRSLDRTTIHQPNHVLDVTQKSYALYFNDRIELATTTFLELGGRLQHLTLDTSDTFDPTAPGAFGNAAAPLSRTDTEPMFNIGLRHFLTHDLSVFSRFGRSVRFATVDELYQANPVTFAQEFSVVDPQNAYHVDVGVDFNTSVVSASVTGYYMNLRDEIHFNSQTFANENLDPTERYGLETTFRWNILESLQLTASYAYLRSRFIRGPFTGNEVPLVPRHTGNLGLTWHATETTTLAASWRYVGRKRFDNDQTNDFGQQIPAYSLLDLKAVQKWGNLDLTFSANNLLNSHAFDFGVRSTMVPGRYNAYPLPERNFFVALGYHFN